jgi:hypothetical protein
LDVKGIAMLNAAIALLVIAALLGLVFGGWYLSARTFMPYQAIASGKTWPELESGVQAVILAVLRIVGGAFAGLGLTILWLCFALHEGARWAPWAILTISAVMLAPALYGALKLRAFEPKARTPVGPTLLAMVLIIAGAVLAMFA